MNFLLKIVEGPNKGAEIALVEGVAVTLGKGDDCDVILADQTLPGEAMKIEVSGGAVSLDGVPLDPFVVKTSGATSFAVGPADAPWSELKWPAKEEPEHAASDDRSEEETAATEVSSRTSQDQEKGEPAAAPGERKRRVGLLGCLLALLIIVLLLVGLVWFFRETVRPYAEKAFASVEKFWSKADGRRQESPEDGASGLRASSLSAIAARYGLSFSEDEGLAKLSGNFKTRRERPAATAEAYAVQPGVELDLSDDESFRTAAEDALFTLSEGALKVATATNRILSIVGSSRSPMALKKALVALNADLPKLDNVDVSGVIFGGVVVSENESADNVGDARHISSRGSRRAAKKNTAAFPVCGILTTPYPCIVLRDGRRLMEGAAIGDSVIVEIGADAVTLTNSTGRFTWKP